MKKTLEFLEDLRDSMSPGETRTFDWMELKGVLYMRGVDRPLTRVRNCRVHGLLFQPGKPVWTFVRVS